MGMIGLILALMLGAAVPWGKDPARLWTADVSFRPKERAVSNWRIEAMLHADASLGTALALLLGRDPAAVTRCVRLNNYWCIKRAGWAGEIAADQDGHVAFASAAEGADVAALLLRRYYVDYGRHSALSIIAHWAPAACGSAAAAGRNGSGGKAAVAAADHLATHGLRQTLRARFLAAHGHRLAAGPSRRMRRSVVPDRLIGTRMRAPVIAIDLGSAPVPLPLAGLAALPLDARASRLPPGLGADRSAKALEGMTCAGDALRIKAYAAKAAAGIAASPEEDLHLFDAAGRPTANLARVMRNMAAVEIGPLGAKAALVAAAVDHAARLAAR